MLQTNRSAPSISQRTSKEKKTGVIPSNFTIGSVGCSCLWKFRQSCWVRQASPRKTHGFLLYWRAEREPHPVCDTQLQQKQRYVHHPVWERTSKEKHPKTLLKRCFKHFTYGKTALRVVCAPNSTISCLSTMWLKTIPWKQRTGTCSFIIRKREGGTRMGGKQEPKVLLSLVPLLPASSPFCGGLSLGKAWSLGTVLWPHTLPFGGWVEPDGAHRSAGWAMHTWLR